MRREAVHARVVGAREVAHAGAFDLTRFQVLSDGTFAYLRTTLRNLDPTFGATDGAQLLDLYVCLRPVRWFEGVPSPVKRPEAVDMVIFRENTEDIYAGLEAEEGTPEAAELIGLLQERFGWNIRADSGVGIKPISAAYVRNLIDTLLMVRER